MRIEISEKVQILNGILCEIDSIYQSLLAAKSVSDSEFVVMISILSIGEGCLQKDIAANSHMSKKTINSTIKKFEKEGYIKLKAGKYPNMHIHLTKKGLDYVQNSILPIIEVENDVLNNMSEDAFAILVGGYTKYIKNFKNRVETFIKEQFR